MKIAIITSGILPVPAVQGGAVENLIDFYLQYNDTYTLHDITVYSVYHHDAVRHPAQKSKVNHYKYVTVNSWWYKIGTRLYSLLPNSDCYHSTLELYFELVYRKIKKQAYDLIILENRPGFAIKLKKRISSCPIVSHIHTNMLFSNTEQNRLILNSTDLFITVSHYIEKQIKGIGLPTKTTVVYNGIDYSLFDSKSFSGDKKQLGYKKDDFIIVYSGRLVPDKGIKELLFAFQYLSNYSNIKLLILGGENFADKKKVSPFQQELHRIASTLNDRVRFEGYVSYHQLPRYLSVADVMVVPSHINEAFGMTCIEACAMGLPVIATNDGGIPETLLGQKHILIEKEGDLPQQISEAILYIKNHKKQFQGNTISEIFTKEVYAQSFFHSIAGFS